MFLVLLSITSIICSSCGELSNNSPKPLQIKVRTLHYQTQPSKLQEQGHLTLVREDGNTLSMPPSSAGIPSTAPESVISSSREAANSIPQQPEIMQPSAISTPAAPPTVCGPQKDALENAERDEEEQVHAQSRAAVEVSNARERYGGAKKRVERLRRMVAEAKQDVNQLKGSVQAKQNIRQLPGGNTRAMRKMLTNLRKKLRRARRRVNQLENRLNVAIIALEQAERDLEEAEGDVASIEDTLMAVRDALQVASALYLQCMENA